MGAHILSAKVPFSLLELASVREGDTVGQTLVNSVAYARHAESLGFQRFWLAEHHNMQGISSAATSVLIGHIAGATESIRVGSGGVILPNHPPLVIAEQFGTLESLYAIKRIKDTHHLADFLRAESTFTDGGLSIKAVF